MVENFSIPVTIDSDPAMNYEKINPVNRFFTRFIILPFLNIMPWHTGTKIFTKSSKTAAEVHKLVKSSNALEFLYTFDGKIDFTHSFLDGIFTYFWQHNILNAKAVRNRIKLVKKEIKEAIIEVYSRKQEQVNIFSLASGSARAVLEVMGSLKNEGIPVKAKLLDLNPVALNQSKKIASINGVQDSIELCEDKVSNFEQYCGGWKPDLIEMVGFLDYLTQEKAIFLSKKIYNILPMGGLFITCNIKDNYERRFVSKVIEWNMIYRDEKSLGDVLLEGGFSGKNCKIILEPSLIHILGLGKK